MKNKKILCALLTTLLAVSPAFMMSGCVGSVTYLDNNGNTAAPSDNNTDTVGDTPAEVNSDDFGLTDKIEDGVILHAWSWSFNTIKESMADIAAAGYSTIQTSPVNAVDDGGGGMQLMGKGKWYYHYQPTNWTVGNYQLGTEEEFKAMCEEADRYGIKIIVDVVPNHTAANESKVEQSFIDAVGGADELYHKNADKGISNYSDRLQCTTYTLSGLHDVNTENPQFQDYFISYLNQLIADGADGFRYDTAKHIGLPDDPQDDPDLPNNFWERVIKEIDNADSIFNYGEVLQGDNERIDAYLDTIGHTTASNYGAALRGFIKINRLDAEKLSDFMVGGSSNVVTWVESHDNYTDKSSLSLTDEQLILGWAVITANGSGTPLFYDRPYGSDADNQWGDMNRIGAAGSPLYKNTTVKALNRFRNAMTGQSTEITNPTDDMGVLMISRGDKGAVIINDSEAETDTELNIDTKLPDGAYSDRGGLNGEFTVSGGRLTGRLAQGTVAVLYNDGYTDPVAMPEVSISTDTFTIKGDSVEVTLNVSGADSASYTLNNSSADFSNGDSISVTTADNGEAVLKVSATNSAGYTSIMTYWFTRGQSISAGGQIGFTRPTSWGSDVYVYIYDNSNTTNAQWPGEKMTNSGNIYTYTLTQEWNNALVIFNDGGSNQYPAMMEPGVDLESGKTYSADGTVTDGVAAAEEPSGDGITVTFTKPESWSDSVNIYVYQNGGGEKLSEWPGDVMTNNSDGTYSYTIISDEITDPRIVFNDENKNQYPKTGGLEAVDGKTYSVQ